MTTLTPTAPILETQFTTLATSLGATSSTAQKWSTALLARYTEPHRHYHTTAHISSMLQSLTQYRYLIADPTILELAIFFHDIIYDPRRTDNEVQSISCFKDFAREVELDAEVMTRVSAYIERTIMHTLPGTAVADESDLRLFLDFDLEVLGRGEADYAVYAKQIREEYRYYGEREYCAGRIKVLKTFLERERLFFSEPFFEKFEEVARRNLGGEIVLLQGISKVLE